GRCSARSSLRAPCILVVSSRRVEDDVSDWDRPFAPLGQVSPPGSVVVPVWSCREPEQLPGPYDEPASCKVGRGAGGVELRRRALWRLKYSLASTWRARAWRLRHGRRTNAGTLAMTRRASARWSLGCAAFVPN